MKKLAIWTVIIVAIAGAVIYFAPDSFSGGKRESDWDRNVDKTENKLEDAGDDISDSVDDAADSLEDHAEDAKDDIEDALD